MNEITIDGATYDGSLLPSADVVRLTGTFRKVVRCGSAKIGTLYCGEAQIGTLTGDMSQIGTLTCDEATIERLYCATAQIDMIVGCGSSTIRTLDCEEASINRLYCDSAKIGELWCDSATIYWLICDSASIGMLWCGSAKISTLDCGLATIDRLWCDSAKIDRLRLDSATINGASTTTTPETIRWAKRLVADIDSHQLRLDMSGWHDWEKRPKKPDGYCNTTHCIAGAIQCGVGDWESEPADVLRREAPGLAWLMYASDEIALRELRRIAALT